MCGFRALEDDDATSYPGSEPTAHIPEMSRQIQFHASALIATNLPSDDARLYNASYSQNIVYVSSTTAFGGMILNQPAGMGVDASGNCSLRIPATNA